MTSLEAQKIISSVCHGEISLRFTSHFWVRVQERIPEFKKQHVYYLLRLGTLIGEPLLDENRNNHKVKVRAVVPEFGQIELVMAISRSSNAVCVTIYEKRVVE